MLLVNQTHQRIRRWQHIRDKDKDGLFRVQLDAFPNDVDKLAHGEVRWHQVLFLVDGGDVRLFGPFDDAEGFWKKGIGR